MKFFATVATIFLGVATVSAVATPDTPETLQKRCIPNGGRCKADGSIGICCSKYCLQIKGKPDGKCQ